MIDPSAEREARAKAGRSPGRTVRLDVTWLHDRMHAVLPVDRDRALPWLLLASVVAILSTSVSNGLFSGLVLCILPVVFRDRRRASITIDRQQVTVERWFLGRPKQVRIPLLALRFSISDSADRLRLMAPDVDVRLRWGGSAESLRWLADQIVNARSAASPVEVPPAPPSELSRLMRRSARPGAGEDHFRV